MQREYQVDVCDLWRGTLSLRKLRVLLDGLPADSKTARAFAEIDDELASWSLTDALLGRLADELALLRWQWESAHLAKHQRPRKQPVSVLPKRAAGASLARSAQQGDADVIPLVSPHRLGAFITEDESEAPRGD